MHGPLQRPLNKRPRVHQSTQNTSGVANIRLFAKLGTSSKMPANATDQDPIICPKPTTGSIQAVAFEPAAVRCCFVSGSVGAIAFPGRRILCYPLNKGCRLIDGNK